MPTLKPKLCTSILVFFDTLRKFSGPAHRYCRPNSSVLQPPPTEPAQLATEQELSVAQWRPAPQSRSCFGLYVSVITQVLHTFTFCIVSVFHETRKPSQTVLAINSFVARAANPRMSQWTERLPPLLKLHFTSTRMDSWTWCSKTGRQHACTICR